MTHRLNDFIAVIDVYVTVCINDCYCMRPIDVTDIVCDLLSDSFVP